MFAWHVLFACLLHAFPQQQQDHSRMVYLLLPGAQNFDVSMLALPAYEFCLDLDIMLHCEIRKLESCLRSSTCGIPHEIGCQGHLVALLPRSLLFCFHEARGSGNPLVYVGRQDPYASATTAVLCVMLKLSSVLCMSHCYGRAWKDVMCSPHVFLKVP